MLLKQRSWVILVFQTALIFLSLICAWLIRFELSFPRPVLVLSAAPLLILFRIMAMERFNLMHGYWRFTGVSDAADIVKATALGSIGFVVTIRWVLGVVAFPISIYLLEPILSGISLAGVRLVARAVAHEIAQHGVEAEQKRVLVVGAGFAAQLLLRELKQPGSGYLPVGCIDDDTAKQGIRIHGIPVLGTVDRLPEVAKLYKAEEIFIAVPSASGTQMRRIVHACEQTESRFRTIPSLRELIVGRTTIGQLREVKLEDLLGREPVKMDLESVRQQIAGEAVMVTGAAGSIGSELCRQILKYHPAILVCVDQDETGLFELEINLRREIVASPPVLCVADISDTERMTSLLLQYQVRIILHAAAYKHVPLMETNVAEAVKNNIVALVRLLDTAEGCGCESFLLISSDKAVNPTSVMGSTKRVGELILAARPGRMRCVSVRFGNVLGSQGSVVPVFQAQIRDHGRVTITHPEITRFFMTIPEAVCLVLQAFSIGKQGDTLVLDMGEPVRIIDLARTLIRLSGKSEHEVQIVCTGLRKGEKLYEELFYETEQQLPTDVEKVIRTTRTAMPWPTLVRLLHELELLAKSGSPEPIRAKIKQIIPEYSYSAEPSLPVAVAPPLPAKILSATAGASD